MGATFALLGDDADFGHICWHTPLTSLLPAPPPPNSLSANPTHSPEGGTLSKSAGLFLEILIHCQTLFSVNLCGHSL